MDSAGQRRIAQAAIDRAPAVRRRAVDRQRPAASMTFGIAEFQIVLDHGEQRHHVLGRPAGTAKVSPFVEGIGHAADRDLAVHHRAAAEALAAPVEARLLSATRRDSS